MKYETLFANLAHQNGYKVILMPAQNLIPNFSEGALQRQDYLNQGLATTSAKLADIYEIQAQPHELLQWRSSNQYLAFLKAAVQRAKAANPKLIVFAGISTLRVSGADELYQDYLSSRGLVAGYWLNVPKASGKSAAAFTAAQFLQQLPDSVSSAARTCASSGAGS